MHSRGLGWIHNGRGVAPRKWWTFSAEAPVSCVAMARETGEVVASDSSGGLYRLDRSGRVSSMTHGGFGRTTALAVSDTGEGGVALYGENQVCCFDPRFNPRWTVELPAPALGVAVDPRGRHIAVSLSNLNTVIYDAGRNKVGRFETSRPLRFLQLVVERAVLIGAAEYGLLCGHTLDGQQLWSRRLFSNVGDLDVTGNGEMNFLAGYSQGVLCFGEAGEDGATFVMEGTPNRLSVSYDASRLVVSTLERHIYWLDADGELLWAAETPEDVTGLCCEPLGGGVVCGFASGQIVRLGW